MGEAARFTRYHAASNSPPDIEKVFKAIAGDRQIRRFGYLKHIDHFRGLMAAANHIYQTKGKADDVWRFMLNHGVVIKGRDGFWYDEQRAMHVLRCCEKGSSPDPIEGTPETRIAAILKRRLTAVPSKVPAISPVSLVPVQSPSEPQSERVPIQLDQTPEGAFVIYTPESLQELSEDEFAERTCDLDTLEAELGQQRELFNAEYLRREQMSERFQLGLQLKQVEDEQLCILEEQAKLSNQEEAMAKKAAELRTRIKQLE